MKIVDCFPFFDEFMILDIRFRELYDIVDKFYIIESRETFTGNSKPLLLSECYKERYPQYADKIEIVVPDIYNDYEAVSSGLITYGQSVEWRREYFQKNHISKEHMEYLGLDFADIIFFSDADEIPRRDLIVSLKENGFRLGGEALDMPCFYYKFNVKSTERIDRAKYIQYGLFTNHTLMRYTYYPPVIENGGWHFTSIKTAENIHKKINAFSHQEFNNDNINKVEVIQKKIESLEELFANTPGREYTLSKVEIDDSYPEYIKENIDKLKEWIA